MNKIYFITFCLICLALADKNSTNKTDYDPLKYLGNALPIPGDGTSGFYDKYRDLTIKSFKGNFFIKL